MQRPLLETVRELRFPLGRYVVIGSGLLDVLGIREANDIDIAVTSALYAQLAASPEWQKEERYGKVFLRRGDVEINPRLDWDGYPTTEGAIATALIVDGVPFMNTEELKRFKRALGREKDREDIALLESYEAAQDDAV